MMNNMSLDKYKTFTVITSPVIEHQALLAPGLALSPAQ
jgi:hypothetical protein